MKFSSFLSTAALVAACAATLPSQANAGDLQVMGKAVKGTNQLMRRHSPRRLQAHGGIADPARRGEPHLADQDVLVPRQKKLKHKRNCKASKGKKGHSSGSRGSDSASDDDASSSTPQSHPSGGNKGSSHGHGHGSGHGSGNSTNTSTGGSGSCFPALGFNMPSKVPSSTDGWWCDPKDEVAFMGFSYSVSGCPDGNQMTKDFKRMRKDFSSRYVRPYGGCDKKDFTNQMIDAAWDAGVGIYPMIWFGFDGGDQWKKRRDNIVSAIKSNPKGPYVVRGVVVGSEPLFDNVLPGDQMAQQIKSVSASLKPYTGSKPTDMQVTLSEMPYAFSINSAAKSIFSALTVVQANVLPFFDQAASTASKADTNVKWNLDFLKKHGDGKKILFTQTGWPSNKDVWPGNNKNVVASVQQEKAYFDMLDQNACGFMKDAPQGGVGWFAHIWSDNDMPGWGILDNSGKPKFSFKPKTSCD